MPCVCGCHYELRRVFYFVFTSFFFFFFFMCRVVAWDGLEELALELAKPVVLVLMFRLSVLSCLCTCAAAWPWFEGTGTA